MRIIIHCILLSCIAFHAYGAPLDILNDEASDDIEDAAIVESTIREVRAVQDSDVAPANFEKVYDSGDKGDIGYTRQMSDNGKNGYQKFDSFHKKAGDSYGYEKHDSFGHKDKGGASGHSGKAAYSQKHGDGKKANYQAAPEDASSYEVNDDSGDDYEENDETASDGENETNQDEESASEEEGGIDESGHDESDSVNYSNPSGYSYGSGDDYNF